MKMYKIFKILFLVIIPLLNINCQEERKNIDGVEIISDYDSDYLTMSEVNKKPQGKKVEIYFSKIENELKPKDLFNKIRSGEHLFLYEIYLNEKGTVDKIKIIEGMGEPFDKALLSQLGTREFEPAKKNNNNVKSRFIWFWKFNFDIQGGFSIKWYLSIDESSTASLTSTEYYYTMVDEMPIFPGGDMALLRFLAENIKYPEEAKKAGIEGKVYIKAYVDETGNIAVTEVLKGAGYGMDEAAVDAVKKLKFNPGKQNGKPVKVQIVIPISFKIS